MALCRCCIGREAKLCREAPFCSGTLIDALGCLPRVSIESQLRIITLSLLHSAWHNLATPFFFLRRCVVYDTNQAFPSSVVDACFVPGTVMHEVIYCSSTRRIYRVCRPAVTRGRAQPEIDVACS